MEDLEERLDDLSQKIEDTYDDIADNWNKLSERQKRKVMRFRSKFLGILNDELNLIKTQMPAENEDRARNIFCVKRKIHNGTLSP